MARHRLFDARRSGKRYTLVDPNYVQQVADCCPRCGWPNWLREHECSGSEVVTYEGILHRTELIPGGNGARIGYSNDFPGRQFLIIPKRDGEPYPDNGQATLPQLQQP